jgi:hypothetical protein
MTRKLIYVAFLSIALVGCATPTYITPPGLTAETGATVIGSKQEISNVFVEDARTFIGAIDGQTTAHNRHEWDKPVLVAPGPRTIQIVLRQAAWSGSAAVPAALETGKWYVARGVKISPAHADVWMEEKESGKPISEKLTLCLTNDAPIFQLFSRCK